MSEVVETKVAVGSFTGIVTGLLTWALVAYVPAFRSGLPPQLAAFIPVIVAWLAHSAAAYWAPHTPRPDTPRRMMLDTAPTTRVQVPPPPASTPPGTTA